MTIERGTLYFSVDARILRQLGEEHFGDEATLDRGLGEIGTE